MSEAGDPHLIWQEIVEASPGNSHQFDTSITTRHTYLGDVCDVESVGGMLEAGHCCRLPLLAIPGLVLMPGHTLPLKLTSRQLELIVEVAVSSPPPHKNLIVVACWNVLFEGHGVVACTAELQQMRLSDNSMCGIAVGKQRCLLKKGTGMTSAKIEILPDERTLKVPKEAIQGMCHWGAWVYKACDAEHYAAKARQAFEAYAPQVRLPDCDACSLSRWLSSNLLLSLRAKQELLAEGNICRRLQRLLQFLSAINHNITCSCCAKDVSKAEHLVTMSEGSSGNVFVNSHGYAHDLVTLREMREVELEGELQTEYSWFPGYAWIIAVCKDCRSHLGWLFVANIEGLMPRCFWGVRSQMISNGSRSNGLPTHSIVTRYTRHANGPRLPSAART